MSDELRDEKGGIKEGFEINNLTSEKINSRTKGFNLNDRQKNDDSSNNAVGNNVIIDNDDDDDDLEYENENSRDDISENTPFGGRVVGEIEINNDNKLGEKCQRIYKELQECYKKKKQMYGCGKVMEELEKCRSEELQKTQKYEEAKQYLEFRREYIKKHFLKPNKKKPPVTQTSKELAIMSEEIEQEQQNETQFETDIVEREKAVQAALIKKDIETALKKSLENPPLGTKNPELRTKSANIVNGVLSSSLLKEDEIVKHVNKLSENELDVLMKYIYRCLETGENNSAPLFKWHKAVKDKSGIGCIVRALVERKTV